MFFFSSRKRHVEISGFLRHLCDSTTPNNGLTEQLCRNENRYNRTLPAVVWKWDEDRTDPDKYSVCITKDITDHGIGLVMPSPPPPVDVAVCLRSSENEEAEPWFFLGHVVRAKAIGGGYWVVGVELTEFMNKERPESIAALVPHAERLLAVTACSAVG